jgi:Spy/CpxP family protein refolding chaperone
MKRFLISLRIAALVFAPAALSALADESAGPPPGGRGPGRHGLRHLEKCLSTLDLSADQQSALQPILSTGKATLRADAEALQADHRKLRTDTSSGADKSVLGQDGINQESDAKKLRADDQAIRDQIGAKLSGDQLSRFNACAQPPAEGRSMGASAGPEHSAGPEQ